MTTILVRDPFIEQAILPLSKEFPACEFIISEPLADRNLPDDLWATVEILYGQRLTASELAKADRLRWIHVPTAYTTHLCYEELKADGTVLITTTLSEGATQVGTFVMGMILTFAKQLNAWQEATQRRQSFDSPTLQPGMWKLDNRVLLQVGLDGNGTSVTGQANLLGLKVWGVQDAATFHPSCHKVFESAHIKTLLPQADIVSICPSTPQQLQTWLTEENLSLIKEDAILVILGGPVPVTEKELAPVGNCRKFRGVLIDAHFTVPPAPSSRLWQVPNLILSPNVSESPSNQQEIAIRTFRKNLRQFLHGSFHNMHHIVTGRVLELPFQG